MKNLHLIPTDKPSRLVLGDTTQHLMLINKGEALWGNQHIYITNDEEIKEGDWFYCFQNNNVLKCFKKEGQLLNGYHTIYKKIILTTDQDLINCFCKCCGVQAIDDEFLEWYVKNPSCEEVEIELDYDNGLRIIDGKNLGYYSYIIPKEEPTEEAKQRAENYMSLKGALEPKQETLEEAAESYSEVPMFWMGSPRLDIKRGFELGAKWEQESMLKIMDTYADDVMGGCTLRAKEWFEQFKKK